MLRGIGNCRNREILLELSRKYLGILFKNLNDFYVCNENVLCGLKEKER